MNIEINIDFDENDNVVLTFKLPVELMDINEELYDEICYQPFYIGNKFNIDTNEIYAKMNSLLNTILNNFVNINNFNYNFNFDYTLSDSYMDKNNIIGFLKENKNLPINFFCSNPEILTGNFGPKDLPNLKVIFKNNNETTSYEEFYNMHIFIKDIINFIKHYNLSPLEQVMLIYDIVKSNEYKKEDDGENYSLSRDLSKIISSKKIVCEGYSNLLNFIFDELGFYNNKIYIRFPDKENGHARNFLYLKDDKYNISGFFFMDATYDSKNEKIDKNYLDNYYFFLKPFDFFKKLRKEIIDKPSVLDFILKEDDEISSKINLMDNNEKRLTLGKLNTFLNLGKSSVSIYFIEEDKLNEEILKCVEEIKKECNKKISKEVFKNALYKVRRIELINNIIKTNLTEEDINNTCNKIYKETPEIRLLKALDLYEEPKFTKSLEEANAKSVEEDFLRMRFLRAIKTKLEDFPENDFIKKM